MKLIHGDALTELAKLPDNSVDLVLTDPPYGTTRAKWDEVIPLDEMWKELKRVTKPRTPIVLFATQPFTTTLIQSNLKNFRYAWTWDKQTGRGHLVAKKRPMQQTEDIVVFAYGAHNYYPIMELREKPVTGRSVEASRSELVGGRTSKESETVVRTHKYPKTILSFGGVSSRGRLHPTEKPVPLLEYLVETYSKPGDTVLDFTMGSGSTGSACVNLGREFIGVELDEVYYNIAKERIGDGR